MASINLRSGQGPDVFAPVVGAGNVEGKGGEGRELAGAAQSWKGWGSQPCLCSPLPLRDMTLAGDAQTHRTPSLGPHHLRGAWGSGVSMPAASIYPIVCTTDQDHTCEGQNLSPALLIPSVSLLPRPTGLGVELVLLGVTFHVGALIHFVSVVS